MESTISKGVQKDTEGNHIRLKYLCWLRQTKVEWHAHRCEVLAVVDDTICDMPPVGSVSFWKLNCVVYAGAVVVEQSVRKPVTLPGPKVDQQRTQIRHNQSMIARFESETVHRKKSLAPTPQ